jgi:putative ABC transport system ATP-binding protein
MWPDRPAGGGTVAPSSSAAAVLEPEPRSPLLRAEGIEKIYRSGDVPVAALRGVSIDLLPGDFAAIMGASGSGKSSFMNIVGCLDRPNRGSYFLDGVDVSQLSRDALAKVRGRSIGFVFQGFNLLPRTSAIENVELPMLYQGVPAKERRRRATEALEKVRLGARLGHTPSQLSGGQQQRVAIARSLVNHPKLLLADEPTGNLDSATSIEMMGIFQRLNDEGITILLVTHEPDIAEHARRIVTFKDGLILSDEPVRRRRLAPRAAEAKA